MHQTVFIFFRQFFDRKKDDCEVCLKGVEGCFKGVLRVFEGCCKVFEGCFKKINRGMKSVRPPNPPVYEIISQKIFNLCNDGFPKSLKYEAMTIAAD